MREKGTNRSQFMRGQVDKYTWVDVGGSFLDVGSAWRHFCTPNLKAYGRRLLSGAERIWERYQLGI